MPIFTGSAETAWAAATRNSARLSIVILFMCSPLFIDIEPFNPPASAVLGLAAVNPTKRVQELGLIKISGIPWECSTLENGGITCNKKVIP
jgi:hypothetical protein